MSQTLHVIGAGGHAKVVIALAEALGLVVRGVYDDQPSAPEVLEHPIIGPVSSVPDVPGTQAVIAIGSNAARRQIAGLFTHVTWASLVHPRAWVAPSSVIGPGTVVMAGGIVQPDVVLGAHVIVNTSASVDHDCDLGDYVHVAPGSHLAGQVTLEEGVFLGAGAVCIPGVSVGAWSIVGAGAGVIQSLPAKMTAAGLPATIRKRNQ